ncbi:cyclic nucleotide-gated ion channel 1-like isoform X1 [Carya illinoinensis]|uniref:cyclic nucleotide-gated ion channel 1-like isoform X1 n=1 Tax=Carya illinoinensis TaxID=32201 RepID=UPI001C71CF0E|nr:cyclic nucleotide-gated ion channel 1-like isoform X1 [Carya illinoinensis]
MTNLKMDRNKKLFHGSISSINYIYEHEQVLVPIIFSEMRDSEFRDGRKFLNAVVLLQYVPRIFRIYRLWKIVNKNIKPGPKVNAERNKNMKGFMVMRAGFNLFLYLVASHVLGAFWYFFSIERETTCWHMACKPDAGCSKTSFNCGHGSSNNKIVLNNFCSIENPNTTLFDFGIFQEARQSRILESMDFLRKTIFCFWWGLRNLRCTCSGRHKKKWRSYLCIRHQKKWRRYLSISMMRYLSKHLKSVMRYLKSMMRYLTCWR